MFAGMVLIPKDEKNESVRGKSRKEKLKKLDIVGVTILTGTIHMNEDFDEKLRSDLHFWGCSGSYIVHFRFNVWLVYRLGFRRSNSTSYYLNHIDTSFPLVGAKNRVSEYGRCINVRHNLPRQDLHNAVYLSNTIVDLLKHGDTRISHHYSLMHCCLSSGG